ncbi:aminotransferase class I/II-fold pyridoxal phosphate-dependent enzyme [Sphingomonadaceae bacterium jetA1]|uniref:TolC family protein n=1 Tax=Facivitalis istanbulensis TaxID=3075838 RepID=UPI00346EF9EB
MSAVAGAGYDRLGYGNAGSASVGAALPIWTGGRVRSAVRAAGSDVAAGAEGLRDTEAEILQGVVTAYRRHVDGIRTRLARVTARVAKRFWAIGIKPWTDPAAGIFLWARLPDGVDAVELARGAIDAGIVLAPGPVFSTGGGWRGHMRFNVAMSDDDRLCAFLQKAVSRPLLESAG